MKNELKLLSSSIILCALAVIFLFSASARGWGGGGCSPPCTPCESCQGGICVNNCLSSLCRACVNGRCETTCEYYDCEICDGQGHCVAKCNPINEECVNGLCIPYIVYTYDGAGNRTTMVDPCGTTSYTYDYLGRLTSVTNPDNKTISYQYDASGNRTQLTDPAENVTTYTYDDDGRLTWVNAPAGATTYQYDSLGNIARAEYPNGTYTEYTYHPQRNWLTTLVNKDSTGAALSSFSYTYDNAGNRLSVTEADSSAVSYGYDDIYQLTSETRTGTNAYTITYQYDDAGNRTQMVKNGTTTSYTYNNNNQLLTETTGGATVTYSYDLNGNLISKTAGGSVTGYAWDWGNRLLSVSEPGGETNYEYDGDGARISKTQNAVITKYINDAAFGLVNVLMETDNTGAVQATYNYGADLISMNRAGVNSFYHYDGLGSTRQLTADNQTVAASYTYDSFGNLIASSGTVANAYGFTGEQQFNEADNFVFLRARYYKPAVGRFISRDPIGYRGGLNLYAYCGNNPINWIDPLGFGRFLGDFGEYLIDREKSLFPDEADPWDGGFRHCLGACLLSQYFGPFGGAMTACWDEFYENIDDPTSVSDMIAERRGESIAGRGESCEEGCLFIYPPGHSNLPIWRL